MTTTARNIEDRPVDIGRVDENRHATDDEAAAPPLTPQQQRPRGLGIMPKSNMSLSRREVADI